MNFLIDLIFIPIRLFCGAIAYIITYLVTFFGGYLLDSIKALFKFIFRKLTTKQEKYEEQTVTTLYQKQESTTFDENEWVVCGKLDRSNTQE